MYKYSYQLVCQDCNDIKYYEILGYGLLELATHSQKHRCKLKRKNNTENNEEGNWIYHTKTQLFEFIEL